jgi:hypothetical protein
MRRLLLAAVLLASLLPLGGCWLSTGVRVPLGDNGFFVGWNAPVIGLPGPNIGTHLGVVVP